MPDGPVTEKKWQYNGESDNVKVKSVEYDNNNTGPTQDPGTVRHAVHPASEPGAGLQQEQI